MKTVKFLFGADLRGGHDMLVAQAKKVEINLEKLKAGEAVVFINRKRDKMKALSYNGVVSFVRQVDTNRPIDLNALDFFAKAFDKRGSFSYDKALKDSLTERFASRMKESTVI